MKIILDESVPQKLRRLIEGGHTIITVWCEGWSGLKNGALLKLRKKQASISDSLENGGAGVKYE